MSGLFLLAFFAFLVAMDNILLVEDNDFVRMQIHKFLADEGFNIIEASDGLTALGSMKGSISLAIVDIRMEPIDGFEFVKSIRAKDYKTPVIFVTGDQNSDILNEANKLGVSAVLKKPVEKDRLVKMAARAISQFKRTESRAKDF